MNPTIRNSSPVIDENLIPKKRKVPVLHAAAEGCPVALEPIGLPLQIPAAGVRVSAPTVRSDLLSLGMAGHLNQEQEGSDWCRRQKRYWCLVDTSVQQYVVGSPKAGLLESMRPDYLHAVTAVGFLSKEPSYHFQESQL